MKNRMLALTAASLLALGLGQAVAQYPPPIGNIVAQPANPTPGLNQTSPLQVTVQSEAGVPAANVACSANVAAQPGSDASVLPASFTTDESGKATLSVTTGSMAGEVKVAVDCGALSVLAVLQVQGGTADSGVPGPPNTGTGPAATDGPAPAAIWLAAAAVVALGGGVAARKIIRR